MRIALLVVVSTFLLPRWAVAQKPQARAEALLEGCERSSVMGGTLFKCPDKVASVADLPQIAPEAAQDTALTGIKTAFGGTVTTRATTVRVGKTARPGLALEMTKGDQVVSTGVIIAFAQDGRARTVVCAGPPNRKPHPCDELMPLLAQVGPAPFAVAQAPAVFAGKPYRAPGGCEVRHSSGTQASVQCGQTAELQWMTAENLTEAQAMADAMRDKLLQHLPGSRRVADQPCVIGGVATTCQVLQATLGGQTGRVVMGAAAVDKQGVFVVCMQDSKVKGVHEACKPVITF
jgi:hypothetical protein